MKRILRSQGGTTLVELVLLILLLSIGIPEVLHLFAEITVSGAQASNTPTAVNLGNRLMEEVKALKFDEISAKVNGNWSTSLSTDAGESSLNKATFDDVDDFNGWVENFGVNYPGFTATVSVGYVAPNDLDSVMVLPQPVPASWTPSYKRLGVTVLQSGQPTGVQISSVVTEVQSL